MKKSFRTWTAILALSLTVMNAPTADASSPRKGPWVNLFDGKSFAGWHGYLKKDVPEQWKIEDGAMVLAGKGGGNLVTDKEYGNFELEMEWKIAEGGNSGIMYHVHEDPKFHEPYQTGPEVQVLDNERHPDAKAGRNGNRTATSLYDMLPPSAASKPAGEWNKVRIVINNGKAEHYMNGKKVLEYPTTGPEWDKMVSESKFKGWEGFGKYSTGHIALQDHGDKVWFRNIRIREL